MPSGSNKKKTRLKVASIASLLSTQHAEPDAVTQVARSVQEALQELIDLNHRQGSSGSSKPSFSVALPYVGNILQIVCWAARCNIPKDPPPANQQVLREVDAQAVFIAIRCLKQPDKLTLEQLRPALRPCPEDGVTPGGHAIKGCHVSHGCSNASTCVQHIALTRLCFCCIRRAPHLFSVTCQHIQPFDAS